MVRISLFYETKHKMIIQLKEELVALNDQDIKLSDFLMEVNELESVDLVEKSLKRVSFKKIQDTLKSLLPVKVTDMNSSVIKEVKTKIELARDRSEPSVALTYTELLAHIDEIFELICHRISFVNDDTMKLVLEFLVIPHGNKSPTMMDELPYYVQNEPSKNIFQIIDDIQFPLYTKFLQERTDKQIMELAVAAVALGIKPLTVLTGCCIAYTYKNETEATFRARYEIPEKYRDAVKSHIDEVVSDPDWTQLLNTRQMKL